MQITERGKSEKACGFVI